MSFDPNELGQLTAATRTLRGEIIMALSRTPADLHCQGLLEMCSLAPDSETLSREVYSMKRDGLLTETRRAPGKNGKPVAWYRLSPAGRKSAGYESPDAATKPPAESPATSPQSTQEPTMPREQTIPVRGTGAAIVQAVQNTPGIGKAALIAEVKKTVPGITEKKISDMLYQSTAAKKIRVQQAGDERTYYPMAPKEKKSPAPKREAKPKKPREPMPRPRTDATPHPPAAAPAPVSLDRAFRFAFGILDDGSIAIAKNGQTIELSAQEARTIFSNL